MFTTSVPDGLQPPPGGHPGLPWDPSGLFAGGLGRLWVRFWAPWASLATHWGSMWAPLARSGGPVASHWAPLGILWDVLGCLRCLLMASWAPLVSSWSPHSRLCSFFRLRTLGGFFLLVFVVCGRCARLAFVAGGRCLHLVFLVCGWDFTVRTGRFIFSAVLIPRMCGVLTS